MINYLLSLAILLGGARYPNSNQEVQSITHINEATTIHFSGSVAESVSHHPMPYIELIFLQGEVEKDRLFADKNGKFDIETLEKGTYDIQFNYAGMESYELASITLEKNTHLDLVAYLSWDKIDRLVEKSKAAPNKDATIYQNTRSILSMTTSLVSFMNYEGDWEFDTKKKIPLDDRMEQDNVASCDNTKIIPASKTPFISNSFNHLNTSSLDGTRYAISNGKRPNPENIQIEELVNSYEYKQLNTNGFFMPETSLTDCPWNKKRRLLEVSLPVEDDNEADNIVVYLGGSYATSEEVKPMLYELVEELGDEDKLSIVHCWFYGEVILEPTLIKNKEQILEVIEHLDDYKQEYKADTNTSLTGFHVAYQVAQANFCPNGRNQVLWLMKTGGDLIPTDINLYDQLVASQEKRGIYMIDGFGADQILRASKKQCSQLDLSAIDMNFNSKIVKSYRIVGFDQRTCVDGEKNKYSPLDLKTIRVLYELELQPKVDLENMNIGELSFSYKLFGNDQQISKSELMNCNYSNLKSCNENTRWAIAVATWGMLLQNSKYNKHGKLEQTIQLAKDAQNDSHSHETTILMMEKSRLFLN